MVNDKEMAALAHLAALTGYVSGIGFVVGPLVVWLLKKDESRFVDYHGRSCLNFQISLAIYGVVWGFLSIFMVVTIILIPVAILGGLALAVVQLAFTVLAALKASRGEYYRYPLSIPFLTLPAQEPQEIG